MYLLTQIWSRNWKGKKMFRLEDQSGVDHNQPGLDHDQPGVDHDQPGVDHNQSGFDRDQSGFDHDCCGEVPFTFLKTDTSARTTLINIYIFFPL